MDFIVTNPRKILLGLFLVIGVVSFLLHGCVGYDQYREVKLQRDTYHQSLIACQNKPGLKCKVR